MSDYFNLNDYPKEIRDKASRFKIPNFKFNKKVLAILLIVLAIPITVCLTLVQQDPRSHAVAPQERSRKLSELERSVFGIDSNGKLNSEKAEFIARIDPKSYNQLLREGKIANPTEVENIIHPRSTQTIRTSSVPHPALTPPTISTCGDITQAGDYSITQDLSSDSGTCINIQDTQNVNIDCQNHLITSQGEYAWESEAISIENVQNFSIKNCKIQSFSTTDIFKGYEVSLVILNSSNGLIQNNVLKGEVKVKNSSYLDFGGNTIFGDYIQFDSSFNHIHNNTITVDPLYGAAAIVGSTGGTNNIIKDNILDGSWDGKNSKIGSDDGIVLDYEKQDIISGNTISNNYDCGIESLALIQDTKIINNQINNSKFCGIGAWYWNSWLNNVIDGNVIDGADYMFFLDRDYDLDHVHDEQSVLFKDNTFSNNVFLNSKGGQSVHLQFEYLEDDYGNILPSDLGNNTFKNNDFGIDLNAPLLKPDSMIIDQGGNKCKDSFFHILKCVALTPAPTSTPTQVPVKKVTITASQDSYVRADQPKKNYGKSTTLQTDSKPDTIAFIKFDLKPLAGKTIESANLVLKVNDPTGLNQILRRVSDANWNENTINYKNRPAFESSLLTFSANKKNLTIRLNVTGSVKLKKGGNITFGIKSADNNLGKYYSRESISSNRPQLIIKYK